MKRATILALALAACSSHPTNASPGDAAAPSDDATPGSAGPSDASADAPDVSDGAAAYDQAVLAARWEKLASGPSVAMGKQDDLSFLDPMNGFVASGPTFSIWKTADGGQSWSKLTTKTGTYYRSVLFLDAMHGFAGNIGAGLDPSISDATPLYATDNGGSTWTAAKIAGPVPSGICNIGAVDATHLYAVGRANGPSNLVTSSDGGKSWTSVDLSKTFMMAIDARFTTPTDGLIIGMDNSGHANVVHTPDAGKTFTTVFTSKTASSLSWKMSFPSDAVGYVAVQDTMTGPPTFAKTTDGGQTWKELPLPAQGGSKSVAYSAIGVGFITENIGWMSPEDGTQPTYRTEDGGQTWKVDPTLQSPINRFRFVDKGTAYAIGGAVWKLTIPGQ